MEKITFNDQVYFLTWHKARAVPHGYITQVSGYIFNENDQLLIVKVEEDWTIPGGKPEGNETPVETLKREVIEETNVTIYKPLKIGHVEVLPQGNQGGIYFQLAYTDQIEPFTSEFESSERRFINVNDVKDYIKWYESTVFQSELDEASKAIQSIKRKKCKLKDEDTKLGF